MSRAAILPHFGDPFNLVYWLDWFRRTWAHEVDLLYIVSSNTLSDEHRQAMVDLVAEHNAQLEAEDPLSPTQIEFHVFEHPIQHGTALANACVHLSQEYVLFVEDDTVIFKRGVVDQLFRRLESKNYDMVGSLRGSCSQNIIDASIRKYGNLQPDRSSFDQGCNFWPNFFFCRRDLLVEHTDLDFNARVWQPGERIEQLDIDITEQTAGDTFVWGSIQLLAIPDVKVGLVDQYHGHPDDLQHYREGFNVFNGQAPWVHHGSLSGWRMVVDQEHTRIQGVDPGEMARRCQWWRTYVDYAVGKRPDYLPELAKTYRLGIDRIIALYEISDGEIGKRQYIYQKLFGGNV